MSDAENTSWRAMWKGFLVAITASFILLQVLFLGNLSYLYATQFHSSQRMHNFNLLYVDYDGGIIGQSVLNAYTTLQGNTFPTLQQSPVQAFPYPGDIRHAVCRGDYWGAIYTSPGGSDGLASALATGSGDLNSLKYVWNAVRYPAFAQSGIYSNIMTLIQATRTAYYASNASTDLQTADLSNPAAVQAFLDPIHATEINIMPTMQGPRILYNTISMVMPIIQQFFFMMALNGISLEFRVLSRLSFRGNVLLRLCISVAYTLIGAVCMTGYIWAFREDWPVTGAQFVLTWMTIWLYMSINFLTVDILTTFVPLKFMPFCILTWIIFSVASTIAPFELNPSFFRWGYALPAHETYDTLVTVWSGGCNNELHRTLPVLFAWLVLGMVLVIIATRHRCKMAVRAETQDGAPSHPAAKEASSTQSLQPRARSEVSVLPSASSEERMPRRRRETAASLRLEDRAYGPRYPNPFEREGDS
ncbi:hypothetical protein BDV59DRAFT_200309 [Aspergillus ambiguus]|uniref:SNG1 family protein n=1 Tax=Aspergillus ambiguus TaxID=176160 RepID=UPI003CCD24C4